MASLWTSHFLSSGRWLSLLVGLRQLTFSREDVVGSVVGDTRPRFPIPTQLPNYDVRAEYTEIFPSLPNLIARLKTSASLSLTATALERASSLAVYVNKHSHNPEFWEDSKRASMLIAPLSHFVLSLPRIPMDGIMSPDLTLREMVRLALLAILARLKRAFSLVSEEFYPLTEEFSRLVTSSTCSGFPELRLWAIISVACLGEIRGKRRCLAGVYQIIGRSSNMTGKTIIQQAKDILWIERLMDLGADELSAEIDEYADKNSDRTR